ISNLTFPAALIRINKSWSASVLLLLGSISCFKGYKASGLSRAASTRSSFIIMQLPRIITGERLRERHHFSPLRHHCEFSAHALLLPRTDRGALDATA